MLRLEVLAVPGYFATMAAEYVHHRSRAERLGPMASDFERRDTITSLSLGTASLLMPMVWPRLLDPITPGKGRYAKHFVAGALGAVATTTIADVVARRLDDETPATTRPNTQVATTDDPRAGGTRRGLTRLSRLSRTRRRQLQRVAQRVASVGGVVSIAAGGTAVTTAWQNFVRPRAMWDRRLVNDLGRGVVGWSVALVGWDLFYYLNHRLWHETRYLWANHVMHHSSERYNLSTALRQAVTDPFMVNFPPTMLSMFGVQPDMVAHARSINLIYQYWIHTDAIDRLGAFEEVGNTPSHHRAHHGVNPQYIDRNHGGMLIIWDRLMGTFVREDEPVTYGLTTNINTFNPVRAAGREYVNMLRDVAGATTWSERLSYVLRGPGWAYERNRAKTAATNEIAAAA